MAVTDVDEPGKPSIYKLGYGSQVGTCKYVAGEEHIVAEAGVQGFLLFGPYLLLSEGAYTVKFMLTVDRPADARPALRIEVCAREGRRMVADRIVSSAEIGSDRCLDLDFKIDGTEFVEFRVFTFGRGRTSLIELPTLSMRPENGQSGCLDIDNSQILYRLRNSVALRTWMQHGASFRADNKELVVTFNGISFSLEKQEDLQLVTEIIFQNEYGIVDESDKLVVDIGMNIGLASLYFANQSSVVEVHSYEPFNVPYRRACRNFALNPDLAKKITACNFGLTDREEISEVQINPDETIGTSIKGVPDGLSEVIRLRSAAEVLGPLLQRARLRNLLVVLKIDCEGSEFAIMESLEAGSLLSQIDVIMMEWHKWWSVNKTQYDIIRPLLAEHFTIFDRTNALNPHAGILYALRRHGGHNG